MFFQDIILYILIGFIIGYLVAIPITKRNTFIELQQQAINFFNSQQFHEEFPKIIDVNIDLSLSLSEIEKKLRTNKNIPEEIIKKLLDEIKKVKREE